MWENKVRWNEGLHRYMRTYVQNTRRRNCTKALRKFKTRYIVPRDNLIKKKYKYCSCYRFVFKGKEDVYNG